jgi:hypothetical protein
VTLALRRAALAQREETAETAVGSAIGGIDKEGKKRD